MDFIKYLIITISVISLLIILFFALKSRKFIKIMLFNAFLGVGLLTVFYLIKPYIGFFIPINEYTVFLSATFGIPAVIMFLCLNVIFL